MKTKPQISFILLISIVLFCSDLHAAGPLDPVRVGRWFASASVGPATPFFGNGAGFGPALKGSFETGMWDAGPGVITLGGEATISFFGQHFGQDWNEHWVNFIFGGRAAFHYGWDVEGLDTYGGIPLGIGFCAHSVDDHPGSAGYTPVFPYAGIFVGASYFFNKQIGVNGEIGYNSTYASVGVVFRVR